MTNYIRTLQFIHDFFDEAVILRQALKGRSLPKRKLLHNLVDKTHLSWRGANAVLDEATTSGLIELDDGMYHLAKTFE